MTGQELLPRRVCYVRRVRRVRRVRVAQRAACLSSASTNVFKNTTTQAKSSARQDCRRIRGIHCRAFLLCMCVLQMTASLPSAFAFTQSEFNTAKSNCLNEAASGICPNVETIHGQIGNWDVSRVSSLYQSKS